MESFTPFFISLIYRIQAKYSQKNTKLMYKLNFNFTSKAMPHMAYTECMKHYTIKNGDVK